MQVRQLGTSDLSVSRVIFGAMPIGGWLFGGVESGRSGAADVVRAAVDAGMSTIDTAPIYGFGLSEEIVGEAIRGRRDDVVICTKTGMRWDRDDGQYFFETTDEDAGERRVIHRVLKGDAIIEECEISLRRLGVETIDLYQCHWPDDTTPLDDTMEAMLRLREQGKIREIGVSNFTPEMIDECLDAAPVVCSQPRYSLLSREIEQDLLPYARERNIGLITYNPLEMGLLSGKVTMGRVFGDNDQRKNATWFQPGNRRRVLDALESVRTVAEKHDASVAQVAIAWILGQPGITAAIAGGRTLDQVRDNARAGEITLDDAELTAIRGAFTDLSPGD